MAFENAQMRQLKAKLDPRHIKTRQFGGETLHYIEGWHAIAEANRIFGFDGWGRETVSTNCVSSTKSRGDYFVAYTAKVRITVRAGETIVVREGSGTGEARAFTPGHAHELALKCAETDATKRALASFGNSFGLALYDPKQSGVRKGSRGTTCFYGRAHSGIWVLQSIDGEPISGFATPKEFADGLRRRMKEATSLDDLFGLWQQNVGTVRDLHRLWRWHSGSDGVDGIALVAHLKACARRFEDSAKEAQDAGTQSTHDGPTSQTLPAKIDKSVLTISEPRRIRSKEHLRFVAQQPCLICGRKPSHAHHVRYAQPRGLALKVSDEFTVPLCAIHHSENHRTGDEMNWWNEKKIDPLETARELWRASRNHPNGPSDKARSS